MAPLHVMILFSIMLTGAGITKDKHVEKISWKEAILPHVITLIVAWVIITITFYLAS